MIDKTTILKDPMDILELDIIDWQRLNGYWENTADALRCISSWVACAGAGGFFVSHIRPSDWGIHERDDFPGWEHGIEENRCKAVEGEEQEGVWNEDHGSIARDYWNWFMSDKKEKKRCLTFSDSPDFYGKMLGHSFFGDIGMVSPMAFIVSIKQMEVGDLWVSLVGDGSLHIVLEARYSPRDYWEKIIDRLSWKTHN